MAFLIDSPTSVLGITIFPPFFSILFKAEATDATLNTSTGDFAFSPLRVIPPFILPFSLSM